MRILAKAAIIAMLINIFLVLSYSIAFVIIGGLYNLIKMEALLYLMIFVTYFSVFCLIFLPSIFIKTLTITRDATAIQMPTIAFLSFVFSCIFLIGTSNLLIFFDPSDAEALGFGGVFPLAIIALFVGHLIVGIYGAVNLFKQRNVS